MDEVLGRRAELEARYYKLLGPHGADPLYRQQLPYNQIAGAVFTAASETPLYAEATEEAYQLFRSEVTNTLANYDKATPTAQALVRAFTEESTMSEVFERLFSKTVDQAVEKAKSDPTFAGYWDKIFAPQLGVALENFDAKKALEEHPEAPVQQEIRDSIKPDGSMEISLDALQKLAKEEFATINTSIDDIQKTLKEISAQQGELVEYMRNEQKRLADQRKTEEANKKHELRIKAAGASISIIANLISIADPKAGKQFATIGEAAVKIGDSLRTWMKAVSGQSGLNKLTSLSTIVMTGNVLNAVMSIVGLFGESQPNPDQIILEEIGRLRQQVNELRTEMHDRFDRVDAQLNAIYTTMHQRFDQIDIQLGRINGRLDEIQQSLLNLNHALSRLERNSFEYLDALGRRPMREAMNGALGYRKRTGLEMPYQPDFISYENTFYSWATNFAFDSLSAGATERDYSDGAVLRELSGTPLDANLNYLNGWLVARGLPPFTNKRLPGLRDWTFASRAYAELGFEWPEHFARIDPGRQAALDALGRDLQEALQNISTIQTPDGPQGNAPLFTALTTNYHTKLAALDSALRASEEAYIKEQQKELGQQRPFDLFGGMDQQLGLVYWPAEFMAIKCGLNNRGSLPAPDYLDNAIFGYNRFALAEYFKIRPLKACLELVWSGEYEHCPNPQNCERWASPRVTLKVFSNNVELLRHTVEGYAEKIKEIETVVQRDWYTYYQPRFNADFSSKPPAPLSPAGQAELEAVSEALSRKLIEHQRAFAQRVLGELDSGPLHTRAIELGGAKKLLESFVSLGLSQAVENDDFLRSLLFSEEALVDDQQVRQIYTAMASQPAGVAETIDEKQLQFNPRTGLQNAGTKRREALSSLLTDYLGGISTENYQEGNTLIATTRLDLHLASAFANSGNRIFLPLLQR